MQDNPAYTHTHIYSHAHTHRMDNIRNTETLFHRTCIQHDLDLGYNSIGSDRKL